VNVKRTSWAIMAVLVVAACNAATPATPTPRPSPTTAPLPTAVAILPGEQWIVYLGPNNVGPECQPTVSFPDGCGPAGNRLLRLDGSGDFFASPEVPLVPGAVQAYADWSPDGQQVAFTVTDPDGDDTLDLWIGDAGKANATRVFDCENPCDHAEHPAWAPDGRSVAYATWDIVNAQIDGTSIDAIDLVTRATRTLARSAGTTQLNLPRWSPDGRSLVVELSTWSTTALENAKTGTAIAVIDLSSASPQAHQLTEWAMSATYPDWSSSRDLLVFSTRPWTDMATGPSNLYVIRPDGSGLTALTTFAEGQSRAVQPTWAPDGTKIIFTKVEGPEFGSPTLAIINADGTGLASATGTVFTFGGHARLRPTT
jgi:dipeptidyl aminopeptidase/acylaminoacyl peptidase